MQQAFRGGRGSQCTRRSAGGCLVRIDGDFPRIGHGKWTVGSSSFIHEADVTDSPERLVADGLVEMRHGGHTAADNNPSGSRPPYAVEWLCTKVLS